MQDDSTEYLDELRDLINEAEREGEKVDSITFEVLRQRAYMQAFHILGPGDPTATPLDSVSVRPREDNITGGAVQMRIWRYRNYGVKERFGMSLPEFLQQPRHIVEYILTICGEEIEAELPEKERAKRDMDQMDRK